MITATVPGTGLDTDGNCNVTFHPPTEKSACRAAVGERLLGIALGHGAVLAVPTLIDGWVYVIAVNQLNVSGLLP
jgi:hypothetical protein